MKQGDYMEKDQLSIFQNWQEQYINEKKVLNMSKNTILNYSRVLDALYDHYAKFEDTLDFYAIDRAFLLSFLESRGEIATNTKNLYITVSKNFFTYISLHNKDGVDFRTRFTDLKAKAKKSDPVSLDNREYEVLTHYLNKPIKPASYLKYRNNLILKLLLFTGIRASELLSISLTDIEVLEEEGVYKILIHGKGNKERYIYISLETIQDELSYIKEYIRDHSFSTRHIAQTSKGRVMMRSELYLMIEKLFKRIGINKRGVHILRHTFGKKMVQKNVNLSTIKELMGHENIQTTMIYARSDEGSMITAVKA